MKIATIYKLTNLVNGKFYIGFTTKSLKKRFSGHIYDSKRHINRPICNAIRKHGRDSFIIEPIYQSRDCTHTLDVMETYFINNLNPHYNATSGGQGSLSHSNNSVNIELRRQLYGHPVVINGIRFKSKNHAAQYITNKFSISRNTALRHIDRGVKDFTEIKSQKQRIKYKVDGIMFNSESETAMYIKQKYGISRNTAIRRLKDGIREFV